jgi:hypothetical protein
MDRSSLDEGSRFDDYRDVAIDGSPIAELAVEVAAPAVSNMIPRKTADVGTVVTRAHRSERETAADTDRR